MTKWYLTFKPNFAFELLYTGDFSKCASWTSNSSITWELREMQIPGPHSTSTQRQTLCTKYSNLCLNKPSSLFSYILMLQNYCFRLRYSYLSLNLHSIYVYCKSCKFSFFLSFSGFLIHKIRINQNNALVGVKYSVCKYSC